MAEELCWEGRERDDVICAVFLEISARAARIWLKSAAGSAAGLLGKIVWDAVTEEGVGVVGWMVEGFIKAWVELVNVRR